jgi:hypothetical protein
MVLRQMARRQNPNSHTGSRTVVRWASRGFALADAGLHLGDGSCHDQDRPRQRKDIMGRKRMEHIAARRKGLARRESEAADLPALKVRGLAVRGIAAGGVALRALATGALAAGAAAIGALAVGAVAVGRLRVGDAAAKKLTVGRLEVDELVIGGRPVRAEDIGPLAGRP